MTWLIDTHWGHETIYSSVSLFASLVFHLRPRSINSGLTRNSSVSPLRIFQWVEIYSSQTNSTDWQSCPQNLLHWFATRFLKFSKTYRFYRSSDDNNQHSNASKYCWVYRFERKMNISHLFVLCFGILMVSTITVVSGQWGSHWQHRRMPHWARAFGFNRPIPHKWGWFNHHARIGRPLR